jgi:hypothetical protein
MKIGGHRTASVFRRYDIPDETDLDDAAARLDENAREQGPQLNSQSFDGNAALLIASLLTAYTRPTQ